MRFIEGLLCVLVTIFAIYEFIRILNQPFSYGSSKYINSLIELLNKMNFEQRKQLLKIAKEIIEKRDNIKK